MKASGYCLVVFGPEATARAWCILDGAVLHVERHGERQQHILTASPDGSSWQECLLGDITGPDNTITHRELRLILTADVVSLTTRSDGWGLRDFTYHVMNLSFAARREDAPRIHFHGPFILKAAIKETAGPAVLVAEIGTAGQGEGSFASISHSVATQIPMAPVARIAFRRKDGSLQRQRVELTYDC
jgi:hypothetical protein